MIQKIYGSSSHSKKRSLAARHKAKDINNSRSKMSSAFNSCIDLSMSNKEMEGYLLPVEELLNQSRKRLNATNFSGGRVIDEQVSGISIKHNDENQ